MRDALGRVQSPSARTYLIVNHTLPTGMLVLNQSAAYTNIPTVTLGLTGNDFNGVSAMRLLIGGQATVHG